MTEPAATQRKTFLITLHKPTTDTKCGVRLGRASVGSVVIHVAANSIAELAGLRVDDWLYCVHESPVSARARGFGVLTFYTRSGSLVASCTQEGLIRRNATRPNLSARLREGLS